jgi:LCP family protein required for cell wall assembly
MKILKYVLLIITTALAVFIISYSITVSDKEIEGKNNINKIENVNLKDKTEIEKDDEDIRTEKDKENINILVLGTDESQMRSDTMIIFSFNAEQNTINILSIPRDTKVKIDNRTQKINAALALKNEEYVVKMIENIINIPISYYAVINFKGFRNIVDIIGGVDFYVPINMYYNDPYQNLSINLKKGMQHLNGKKAEQLVRYRKYEDGDLGRIKIQQDFIKVFLDKVLELKNILKADDIIYEIMDNTKTNIKFSDIIMNMNILKVLTSDNINMYNMPGYADTINGISYYIYNKEELKTLMEEKFK